MRRLVLAIRPDIATRLENPHKSLQRTRPAAGAVMFFIVGLAGRSAELGRSAGGASVRIRSRLAVSLLPVWLWLSMGGSAFAARLLSATVQLNGKTVLHTYYEDDDMWGAPPGAPTVWRYLGAKPLWAEKGAQVQADAADPLQAKLRGILVIRLQHVDRVIVEAQAAELTLIRAVPSGDEWFLPVEEVERLARASGIPDMPPPTLFQRASPWLALSVAAAAVVASIGAWLWLRARRRQHGEQVT